MLLDPSRTVLVDVDTQVDFIEPDGALYVPTAETLKPRFAELLAAAAEAKVAVLASADAHLPNDPEFAQFPPHCLVGTPGQARVAETRPEREVVVDADGAPRFERSEEPPAEIHPSPGRRDEAAVRPSAPPEYEGISSSRPNGARDRRARPCSARLAAGLSDGATVVLEKVAFDLFTNPAAEQVLRETGARTAIVFGVALDYCVRAAALGLRERGYETVLVTDATAPVTAEGGAKAEAELAEAGVRFATTAEVVRALGDKAA